MVGQFTYDSSGNILLAEVLGFVSVISEALAIRRVEADAFDAVLGPQGFSRVARKHTWVRGTLELFHVVSILHRRRQYDVQWGVVSPEAAELLWGKPADPTDVGQSSMSGTPGSIRHPALGQSWTLDEGTDGGLQRIIEAVRADLQVVAERLKAFERRRDLVTYLLQNRDRIDQRDFVIPANLPLKLVTATALALADHDKQACDLLPDVDREMARFQDKLSTERLTRVRQAARALCN